MNSDNILYRQIADAILQHTREGGVSSWVDRIGNLVRAFLHTGRTGIKDDSIDWSGAPNVVAYHVVDEFRRSAARADAEEFLRFIQSRQRET